MTKTKRQLRAEAVERLRKARNEGKVLLQGSIIEILVEAAGHDYGRTDWEQDMDIIADLLEDDELPEGNVVAVMRKASGELHAVDYARLTLEATDTSDMFAKLADMVERDYVRRDDYDFTVEMLNCMKAERDEWKAKAEQAQESYLDAKSDRDAWKAKYLGAMNDAEDYKTLWQRSRERSTKSAKRAATVERLRRYQDEELTNKGYTAKVEYPLDELIDLLTDDDANDDSTPKNNVSANAVDANDGNAMQDSREKLEESAWQYDASYAEPYEHGAIAEAIIELLDRQAAITERHWMEIVGASANCNIELTNQIAELKAKVNALTQANDDYREEWHRVCRERDELSRELHASNRERERLRKQLGIAIDHAHDMIALVNLNTDDGR